MTDQLDSLDPDLLAIVMAARSPVTMEASARHRLLEAIRAEPLPARPTAREWLLARRRITLSPLATALLAAGLVGIGVIAGLQVNRDGLTVEQRSAVVAGIPQLPDSLVPRTVKFVLVAPAAARVAVVGDFNGWDAGATPMQSQGDDGTWTVFVPLQPGLHTYSFVVDGTHFVADPAAPNAPDDGFGHKSSVMLVRSRS